MKINKLKIKFIFSLLLCVISIYTFSLLNITSKKIDNYKYNYGFIILHDNVSISESFDIKHKNLDKLKIGIEPDKKNEVIKNLKSKSKKTEIPVFPDIQYDNEKKSILFEINVEGKKYYKRIFIENLELGYNEINIIPNSLKNIRYKIIDIRVTTNNIMKKDNIKLYTNEGKSYSTTTLINDKKVENEISCIMESHILDTNMLIIFIVITLIIFISKNKNIDIFSEKTKDYQLFIIDFALSIIFSLSLLKFNINYSSYETILREYLLLGVISLFILVKLLLFSIKKYYKCLEKLFVIITLFIGTMYAFSMIPNGAPDENQHYYEARKLSKLDFSNNSLVSIDRRFDTCTYGGKNYKCINEAFYKATDNPGFHEYKTKSTASGYSPILYVPAAAGISIGRILGHKLYMGYYIARLFNLLVTTIFGFFTIKQLTKGKLIMFIYLLNPMYIHQGVSISADVLTNAITMLFISFMFSSKDKFSNKEKTIIFLLTISFYIIKRPYIFLLLLFLIRNNNNFEIKKYIKLFLLFFAFIMVYAIFTNLNYTLYDNYSLGSTLRNPYDFISVFINTISTNFNYYFETLFGSKLGWLEIEINSIYIYTYIAILLTSTIIDKVEFDKSKVAIMLLTGLLIVFSIIFGFYMIYFNQIEHSIGVIQGRYFIQVMVIVLFLLSNLFSKYKIRVEYSRIVKIFSIMLLIIHLLIISQIIEYYSL